MPLLVQLALGAAAVAGAVVVAHSGLSPSLKTAAFVGVAATIVLVALRFERRLPRDGPEATGPDDVMPGARAFFEDFVSAGYRPLGGFRWALRGRLVIASVLAPAERDRYVVVTDRVLEIASRFGERSLITTNSGRAPVPADVLRQVLHGEGPGELHAAHERALDRLAERRLRPDRFADDAAVLRTVRAVEEQALRGTRIPSLATLLRHEWSADERDRELGEDDESELRIEGWLAGEVVG